MNLTDIFEESTAAILSNKARSGLTILGIVIGIASVIAMVSIGEGTSSSIQTSIQSLGSNLVMVSPGAQRTQGFQASSGSGSAKTLTLADANAIKQDISLAVAVAPDLSGRYQITAKGTNTNTSVVGVTTDYATVRNVTVDSGSFISDQDNSGLSRVAVIGPTTRDDLFGEGADPIGQTMRIKGIEFKIIGLTKSKGGSMSGNQDDIIYVPLTVSQKLLAGNQRVSTISIQAVDQKSMAQLQQDISDLLLSRHHISDITKADFSILNMNDLVETASSMTKTLTILLASIAGISLVVGGIGIMNMMLTNVTERTREIGLRKAVGAKSRDINLQFLSESIILTFVGGVMGILLGSLIAVAIAKIGGITTKVSPISILLAVGVSSLTGIVFGY
ncbi:MAG: ABC transporter permease, partial [Candidatus Parcubacteria bacterium]|nr:ABC transporter permease [Candidatus Parcubacteria bacterium]